MIDFHKIDFIYCVNNDQQFQESWNHVGALRVPDGYNIGLKIVKNCNGIANGYNQALSQSNAKYKIYIHQDVNILYQNFLYEILSLFIKYPHLGMLGMLGANRLPLNGVWWEAEKTYGKVYFFGQFLPGNTEVYGEFESVQAIDGMIMITQYDLPWRQDLLPGWHFYDASQSLEFIKAGLAVGVPRQITPWCAHNTTTEMLTFQVYQNAFLNEYRPLLNLLK